MQIPDLPFKVKTVVSWPGEEDGDLGFIENEIVEVYSIVDESWWSGKLRRNNAEGIFPKDYVEIIEENRYTLPVSTSNISVNLKLSTTPVDSERASANNTPRKYTMSKDLQPRAPVYNTSIDIDEEPDYNTTYDQIEVFNRKSKHMYTQPQKARSANQLMLSINHPQLGHLYQQQEELLREKEREITKLQQQNIHPNRKSQIDTLNRQLVSVENGSPKIKKSSRYLNSNDDFQKLKSQSFIDVPSSSSHSKPHSNNAHPELIQGQDSSDPLEDELDYDVILQKKAQLEMELAKLKQLEKASKIKRYSNIKTSKSFGSGDSSFISEDLLSSKRNYCSKESLGKKLMAQNTRDGLVEEEESNAPPPPPIHQTPRKAINLQDFTKGGAVPFDANDFKLSTNSLTEEELQRISQQQEELKNSIKSLQSDVLNLSELSATSAGSFLRHKFEKEIELHQLMQSLGIDETVEAHRRKGLMETVFQDKKQTTKQKNIFMKLLNKRKDELTFDNKFDIDEKQDWNTWKQDLYRMNSLTSADKQSRTKRVSQEEVNIILKPLECISDINTNETIGDSEVELDLSKLSFEKADKFISNYATTSNLNELISDVSVKFGQSPIQQVRCILIHLSKFRIIEESSRIQQIKPNLNKVLNKGEASIFQINYIFKKILDALRIPSEIVLGFWKKPNEFYHNDQFVINHCWLSVLVEDNLLIMDIYCFKHGPICNIRSENGFNEFYFLTKPLHVVSTHIPSVIDLQHILPPIDPNVAIHLPRQYSGFHKNGLRFRNFNTALTRLKDSEIFELELEIPNDVELFTLIKTSKVTTNELCLCQVKWVNEKRIGKIKAILPENEAIGVLQIFAGLKGSQKHFDNIHELAIVIPLYHQGISKPSKFVSRFPTVQSQNNDLYIKQPQSCSITLKNFYNFAIEQHPSSKISAHDQSSRNFKVVIESPSGKYYKLEKGDHTKPYGTYECNIKCQEPGIYRGLVIGDAGTSWYVFAQWNCI